MTDEELIIKEIIEKKAGAVLKLQHYYALNGKPWPAKSVEEAIKKYKEDKLGDLVIRYIANACPKCASCESVVVNYDSTWRDGDVVCSKCRTYIRMYDAG
jgi:hypothetical protein